MMSQRRFKQIVDMLIDHDKTLDQLVESGKVTPSEAKVWLVLDREERRGKA